MPKKRGTYSEDQLQKALEDIRNKRLSKKQAAIQYGIPRATLIFRLSPNFVKPRPGPPTILTDIEENAIENWLIGSQRKGFPKRKEEVFDAVKEFLSDVPRDHPFGENNVPGEGWFKAFLRRHPKISLRSPDPVSSASATVGTADIMSWFDSIEKYLKENNWFSIMEDPNRIFNGDETNFLLCPKTKTVLAAKGAKNIYEVDRGIAKANLTVMFSFGASGKMVPPMIVFPYKRVPDEIRKSIPKGWGIGTSDNGWMTKEVFYEYISKVFHPHLVSIKTEFPIIYFVDGHSTHLTLPVSRLCVHLGIILVALYPNATRILQPADVAAFKPLKNGWNSKVIEWRRNHPGESLNKEKFAPLLNEAILSSITADTLKNGFRACGIFPWNKNAIDYSKCLGKTSKNPDLSTEKLTDLPFQKFAEIVGPTKLQQFENIRDAGENIENYMEEYQILYKLFLTFKTKELPEVFLRPEQPIVNIASEEIIDINSINTFLYVGPEVVIEDNLDTFNFPEAAGLMETVTETPEKQVSITDYLDWPVTPFRKGIKPIKEKKPFVITSPLWIKAEATKKEKKAQDDAEKEKRKIQRDENKKQKELQKRIKLSKKKVLNPKLKPKVSTITSTITSSETEFTFGKSASISNILCSVENFDVPTPPTMNVDSIVCEDNTNSSLHVRNLFPGTSKCDIGENIVPKGLMCFECTMSIVKFKIDNPGVKCQKCAREYHVKCIQKMNLSYLPLFTCRNCKNL